MVPPACMQLAATCCMTLLLRLTTVGTHACHTGSTLECYYHYYYSVSIEYRPAAAAAAAIAVACAAAVDAAAAALAANPAASTTVVGSSSWRSLIAAATATAAGSPQYYIYMRAPVWCWRWGRHGEVWQELRDSDRDLYGWMLQRWERVGLLS